MVSARYRLATLLGDVGVLLGPGGGKLKPAWREQVEYWAAVASERGADAAVLHAQSRQLAALYFVGYVVEAYAKALATAHGKIVRRTHVLVPLLDDCGIRRGDLPMDLCAYVDARSVEMRYELVLRPGIDYVTELARARRLAAYLGRRLNRLL